jgi:aspartate dehydrogenase
MHKNGVYMKKTMIGLVGCGAIGNKTAEFISNKLKDKTCLWAIADKDISRALNLSRKLASKPKVLDVERLIKGSDLVIETASQAAAKEVLSKAVLYKKDVIIVSVGALVDAAGSLKAAAKAGIKVYVPSGAICGVDGLGALSMGKIKSLSLITSKPPAGFIGVDYLKRKNIDPAGFKTSRVIFKGRVNEAIKSFPQNINVAATLLLASGFKDVLVTIKADPRLKHNIHRIEIVAKEASISFEIENVPSQDNPKTSALTVLSVQYLLKKMFSLFKIGS